MSRPTKFTPVRAAKLLEGIKAGMTKKAAAAFARVSYDTLNYWEHRRASFASDIEQALSEAEARYTGVIAKAAFGYEDIERITVTKPDGAIEQREIRTHKFHPTMALEWLKRQRRADWGDNVHVQLDQEITKLLEQIAGASTQHANTADPD